MLNKATITNNFSKSACQYDRYSAIQRLAAERLIEEIPAGNFDNILEIGCGTGIYTFLLHKRFSCSSMRAVDISESMIRAARKKIQAENVVFEVQDAEKILSTEKYNLITSNSAFHWFDQMEEAVLRLSGILNKAGWLVFSVFGPLTFIELASALKKNKKKNNLSIASSYFLNKEALANLLSKMFTRISVKEVVVQKTYRSLTDLLKEIKYTGTQGCRAKAACLWTRGMIDALESTYMEDNKGRIIATYQVFLCRAAK